MEGVVGRWGWGDSIPRGKGEAAEWKKEDVKEVRKVGEEMEEEEEVGKGEVEEKVVVEEVEEEVEEEEVGRGR